MYPSQVLQAVRAHGRQEAAAGGLAQVPAVLEGGGGRDAVDQGAPAPGGLQ